MFFHLGKGESCMFDVIIRNGSVFDSVNGIFLSADVGINGRKIAKVDCLSTERAKVEVDAEGMLVTPGLIDGHLHLFTKGSDEGIPADLALLPNGITSAVDGGTAGVSTYDAFHQIDIHNSIASIKSYINISPLGMLHESIFETTDKKFFSQERLVDIVEQYKDEIIALKLRYSLDLNENISLDNLDVAIEMAEKLKLPLVVHVTNPPVDMAEIAAKLRPGDVFCHCFQGRGDSILGADGRVKPAVWDAKRRGVLFDASNGTKNYSHAVAKAAMAENFYPDFITTDASYVFHSFYKPRCFALPYLMSKYLALGMSLEDVLKRTTIDVARFAHWDHKGVLAEGYDADIAIFKLVPKELDFADSQDEFVHGEKILLPQMTIKEGTIVYRQMDFC